MRFSRSDRLLDRIRRKSDEFEFAFACRYSSNHVNGSEPNCGLGRNAGFEQVVRDKELQRQSKVRHGNA